MSLRQNQSLCQFQCINGPEAFWSGMMYTGQFCCRAAAQDALNPLIWNGLTAIHGPLTNVQKLMVRYLKMIIVMDTFPPQLSIGGIWLC